jgi:hypothetical protein
MAIYTVIPAKRPTGRVSSVLPEPVPAIDEPSRPQASAEPVPASKATGRNGGPGPVLR